MQAVKEGKLREDLYYRLNVFRIDLPPLRDRLSDIDMLASNFLKKRNISIDDNAMRMLQNYRWPGNVRELENVLERAAIVCGGQVISTQHLPTDMLAGNNFSSELKPLQDATIQSTETLLLPEAVQALEIQLITAALQQTHGNKSRASKLLGVSERSLWYKLSRYHMADIKNQ